MKAVSLTMASLMALLIASFACAFAFAFPFPFPAAGTAKDKESIPFVPEHNQQPAPILPRSSTAVLDFGDALLHEGGNSRPVVKPTPHESPASSIVISSSIKDNDDETEENTNHPQQQQPEKQGKPIHHDDDDADDEAGGSRSSSFRNEQVSIDDASEQDLPPFWRSNADKFLTPKITHEQEEEQEQDEEQEQGAEDSMAASDGRPAQHPHHHQQRLVRSISQSFAGSSINYVQEGGDDLDFGAQTIKGYASNIAPYKQSNVRFSDYASKRPGSSLSSSKASRFKPYNSAFSRQTAQKLSAIRVTNAKRFGFRGRENDEIKPGEAECSCVIAL